MKQAILYLTYWTRRKHRQYFTSPAYWNLSLYMAKKSKISGNQWDEATDFFELGLTNGKELALELGVSPQTVMREMRRRGAKKGSRVHETIVNIEARLDREARHRSDLKTKAKLALAERRAAGVAVLSGMMAALVEADRLGDLTLADTEIAQTGAIFGAPVRKAPCRKRK